MHSFFSGFGLLAGGVIGVGIFGLPAVAVRSGFTPFILQMLMILIMVSTVQIAFARVVAGTKGEYQIPGIAHTYLGQWGKWFAGFASFGGIIGAMLAYIIAGGSFLHLLLEPFLSVTPFTASLLYAAIGAVCIFMSLRSIGSVEVVLILLFIVAFGGIAWEGQSALHLSHVQPWGFASPFTPYGVLLFSFWGLSLIPSVVHQVRSRSMTAWVVLFSNCIAAALYGSFALLIVGISGPITTEDALTGIASILGARGVFFGVILGLLTTFTSFVAFGGVLRSALQTDFGVPRSVAWMLAVGAPVVLYVGGIRSLLTVLDTTGAIFLGMEGVVVCLAYRAFRRRSSFSWLDAAVAVCLVALLVGVVQAAIWK